MLPTHGARMGFMQDLCAGNAMPPMLEFMQSAIEWQVLRRPDPLIQPKNSSCRLVNLGKVSTGAGLLAFGKLT